MPTLKDVIDLTIERRLNDVHTSMPGKVERVDLEANVVDVRPLLQARVLQEDGTIVAMSLPMVPHVPLEFRGGGGFRETWPVAVGDIVRLEFSESALDGWWKKGGQDVDPTEPRRFHLFDAVAVPGMRDSTQPWTGGASDAATWGKDGGPQLVAKAGEIHLGASAASAATEAVVLGSTYTGNESSMLTGVSSSLTTIATSLGIAAGTLTAAAAANVAPIVGGGLALPGFVMTIAQLAIIASQLSAIASQLGVFQGQLPGSLSNVVKTR